MSVDMAQMGVQARAAARVLALAPTAQKNAALAAMAKAMRRNTTAILSANAIDLQDAAGKNLKSSFVDRLTLSASRIDAMAQSLEEIAALADPVGKVTSKWTRPNGMEISRVSVPIGVIGIIFESRPNVTILRGGSDGLNSARAIAACLVEGLKEAGLPEHAIQLVQTTDRAAVGDMLTGLNGNIDLIVPRGGKSLVARVQSEARVPVFSHLEGICHVYVDRDADLEMANKIALNAKMRRTGVCGSAETILVDKPIAAKALSQLVKTLADAGCEVRGDTATMKADARVIAATEEDWSTEYLDAIISVKVVDGVQAAMGHIAKYGSQHTDLIITTNTATAEKFLRGVDSAIVLHNASTQFADGGEFGFGAEIGIATGKMHARGPVGVEQLTTFKYQVRGTGQTRP
jgi:glutamate-5-semialdehyde dehydrogenase